MNWDVFTRLSTFQVQLHWLFAVAAFILGIVILVRKKGTATHVFLGRLWVAMMVVVSFSATFIKTISAEDSIPSLLGFSPIHILVPITLLLLFFGVRSARKRNIKTHKMIMILTVTDSLIAARAFTFLPGRHMHTFLFGTEDQIEKFINQGYKK